MRRSIYVASFTALTLALGGCASSLTGDTYSRDEARAVQTVRYGTIESLRPVKIEGTKTPIGTGAGADGGLGSLDLHWTQRFDGSVTHGLYGSRLVPRIGISGQAGGAPTQSERQSCKGSDINGPTHCNSPADSCFVLNGGMSSSDKKALGNFSVLTQHLLPS